MQVGISMRWDHLADEYPPAPPGMGIARYGARWLENVAGPDGYARKIEGYWRVDTSLTRRKAIRVVDDRGRPLPRAASADPHELPPFIWRQGVEGQRSIPIHYIQSVATLEWTVRLVGEEAEPSWYCPRYPWVRPGEGGKKEDPPGWDEWNARQAPKREAVWEDRRRAADEAYATAAAERAAEEAARAAAKAAERAQPRRIMIACGSDRGATIAVRQTAGMADVETDAGRKCWDIWATVTPGVAWQIEYTVNGTPKTAQGCVRL